MFFDPDVRGEATLPDAENLLVELRAGGKPNEQDLQRGDRIMVQNYFASATELDVRRQMGSGFSEPLMQLEPGQWHGPVSSGFGVHLVYIYGIERAPPANLEDVRTQVIEDWHQTMREEFNAQFVEGLMDQYEIVIEALPEDRLLDGRQTNSPEGEGSAGNQAQADANS